MKALYTIEEFNNAKSFDKLPCECYTCKKEFLVIKKSIKDSMRPTSKNKIQYCSLHCAQVFKKTKVTTPCKQCGKEFEKMLSQYKKSINHFCSYSCNATYKNMHKIGGNCRSKLELFIENNLKSLYTDIDFIFNDRRLGYELDIYIPSLKLAFELNGITHYEPIYGDEKLMKTITNDKIKKELCEAQNINLVILDTSKHSYITPKTSQKFLDIIISYIK